MKRINMRAMAKINIGLDVIRKREDGYHDLKMIMQTVRWYDRIALTVTAAKGIRLKTHVGFLGDDENNLAYRAARLLLDEFPPDQGLYIDLEKHIPVAAGLGGGSSDAAAVLVGVNRLFDLGLSRPELMERAVSLGADVPYCILRGSALAEGIGEKLTPLPPLPPCFVLLAKPAVHVSTKFVYTNLHLSDRTVHPDIDGQVQAIREGDLRRIAGKMGNVLEEVTIPAFPVIARIRDEMLQRGALGAMMSGSGPTVFGLFEEEAAARGAANAFRENQLARQICLTTFYPGSGEENGGGL